jgi:hypothetical protein
LVEEEVIEPLFDDFFALTTRSLYTITGAGAWLCIFQALNSAKPVVSWFITGTAEGLLLQATITTANTAAIAIMGKTFFITVDFKIE